jgi:uncharacterized membrane protein
MKANKTNFVHTTLPLAVGLLTAIVLIPAEVSAQNSILDTPISILNLQTLGENVAPITLSADGNIIVGENNGQTFRWTSQTGLQTLGTFPRDSFLKVTNAGNISVKAREDLPDVGTIRKDESATSIATAISSNDTAIVGTSTSNDSVINLPFQRPPFTPIYQNHAFRWTQETGITDLGVLRSGGYSIANAVSADGSVVVGQSVNPFDGVRKPVEEASLAFRWTKETGMTNIDLGSLQRYTNYATAVSGDGSIVGGISGVPGGVIGNGYAWIWSADNGARSIYDLLLSSNTNIMGWESFNTIRAISEDGSTIVGQGSYNGKTTAYTANIKKFPNAIPEPTTLSLLAIGALSGILARRNRR